MGELHTLPPSKRDADIKENPEAKLEVVGDSLIKEANRCQSGCQLSIVEIGT